MRATVIFRVDASTSIGNGHVARCLTLAASLRDGGARSVFVCRKTEAHPSALVAAQGHEVLMIGGEVSHRVSSSVETPWAEPVQRLDASQTLEAIGDVTRENAWIVVDQYGLGAAWEQSLAPHCSGVLAIDDLANRPHACSMLLDQNYYRGLERRYERLVPPRCRLYLGPQHALLRPEFEEARRTLRKRDGTVRRILVSFGSHDERADTLKTLNALLSLNPRNVAVDVVVGTGNPRRSEVRALCAQLAQCAYHEQIDYMARLIAEADLAVGAGGATTWERCVLGLPTLTIVAAANQLQTTLDTAAAGATVCLGESDAVGVEQIASAIAAAMRDAARNRDIGARAMALVPRADGAARLAHTLLEAHARRAGHDLNRKRA